MAKGILLVSSESKYRGRACMAGGLPMRLAREMKLMRNDVLIQVFQHSLDGIVITGPDTVILDLNPAFERIVGYERNELIGRKIGILKSGRTPRAVYVEMWRDLGQRGSWMGELINRRKNGEEWYSFFSITRLVSDDGALLGYVGLVRDVTERRRSEHILEDKLFELTTTQQVTVRTLAQLAEHKDPGIAGHLDRIQQYSRILAEAVAETPRYSGLLPPDFPEKVAEASILHDIGKVGIPEGILFKPARLSAEEFLVMQLHTKIGADILGQADQRLRAALRVDQTFLTMAREIALHHHERWDGMGYPEGLRGEQIPLAARIVAVADVYDDLTSRRVYKALWPHDRTREMIASEAGRHFDPEVVEAFFRREYDILAVRNGREEDHE